MVYGYRVWVNAAVFALTLAMIAGVSMTKHSSLFVLFPLAPLILVVSAAFILAALNGERWALALLFVSAILVFAVDFRGKLAEDEFARPPHSDGFAALKFAVFILVFLGGAAALRALPKRGLEMPGIVLTLYLAWALVTAPVSTSPTYTIGATFGLAAWTLFAIALNEQFRTRELILLVVSAGGIFCAGSLVAYVFFPEYGQFISYDRPRLTGLASVPNLAAQIAAICLISVLAFYMSGFHRDGLSRPMTWWMCISSALALPVLLLTQTRGALGAAVLAAIALVLRRYRIATAPALAGLVLALLIVMAIMVSPRTLQLIIEYAGGAARSGSAGEILSFSGRLDLWAFAVDRVAERPIGGYGYGASASLLAGRASRWGEVTTSAHNALLQTMLDLGVVGGALLIVVFGWSFLQFWRNPSPFRDGIFVIIFITCLLESAVSKAASALTLLWLVSIFVQSGDSGTRHRSSAPRAHRMVEQRKS